MIDIQKNILFVIIKNIFILSSFVALLGAGENLEITPATKQCMDETLASQVVVNPLKESMGGEAYNDAIGSGKYRYVGNSKCRLCHRKFFIGRKKDPHDHAMKNLIAIGHEKTPQCLACHSTGYGVPTGFVSIETTPRLSNVQCEGCHGPGNVHIKLTKKRLKGGFLAGQDSPKILKNMCVECHTDRWNKSYHDLDTAYNKYKKADPRSYSKGKHNNAKEKL